MRFIFININKRNARIVNSAAVLAPRSVASVRPGFMLRIQRDMWRRFYARLSQVQCIAEPYCYSATEKSRICHEYAGIAYTGSSTISTANVLSARIWLQPNSERMQVLNVIVTPTASQCIICDVPILKRVQDIFRMEMRGRQHMQCWYKTLYSSCVKWKQPDALQSYRKRWTEF
jgi:hypothetical protein